MSDETMTIQTSGKIPTGDQRPSPAVKINPVERKVLTFLAGERHSDGGFFCFAGIAAETQLERKAIRRACRSLARKGLTEYERGLWSDEGRPGGAGYGATKAGEAFLEAETSKRGSPVVTAPLADEGMVP